MLVELDPVPQPPAPLPVRQLGSERLARIASLLTNPICLARESWWISKLPGQSTGGQITYKTAAVAWGALGLLSTLPAIGLRKLSMCIREGDFLYQRGFSIRFEDPSKQLTTLFWNVCGVPGGYAITDGGVAPWPYRHTEVVEAIKGSGADVVCLMEVFDTDHVHALIGDLKDTHTHFFHSAGPRSVGAPAGFFIASKYSLRHVHFEEFDKTSGRSRFASKGFASFEVIKANAVFARVLLTHGSHSESPEYPTEQEKEVRRHQFNQLALRAQMLRNAEDKRPLIVGGDFNGGWEELKQSWFAQNCWRVCEQRTWGGDGFCVTLRGGQRSGPLALDHVFITNQRGYLADTKLLKTGFDGDKFKPGALSDHSGLITRLYPI